MSVVDVLSASEAHPRSIALAGDGRAWSYTDLADRVDARRAELGGAGSGRGPGDIVPIMARPTLDVVVDLLAVWRLGTVPVPLNPRLTDAEAEAARAALRGARLPEGTQVVLWTSGTSGRPRGVALSWANLEASARAAAERLGLGPSDAWLLSLSPAHVGGLALVTRSLLLGGKLVVASSLDVGRISAVLDGEEGGGGSHPDPAELVPTHLSLVPTQLLRLLDHRGARPVPPALRCVLVGGAHAPASLVRRALAQGWPLALTYGATEMASQIATAPPGLAAREPGTVGGPLPGVEVRVSDDGELWARGPTRALAYVGGDGAPLADADGWYHTGDLGRIDGHGRLRVTGRRSDRIVSGGVTVDAVEVEEALRAHPTVIDACVVGVPDEEWGERVGAWVEPVVGELDLEELERHLRERLSAAKRPRLWHVEGGLPRNANGKADRIAVREALEASRRRKRGRVPPPRG